MSQKSSIIVIGILAVIAIVFSLTNLNKGDSGVVGEDTLARVQKTGKIEACTVINPPTTIKDSRTGELSGHMVETLEIIAKRLNAEISWHESTFGNAAADLSSKRCDVVVAPFFANMERAQAVAFTQPPLLFMGHGAIVRRNDLRFNNVKSVFDFDKPEITVVVATGEVGDIFVKENFKQAKVKRIDVEAADLTRFIIEVSTGRADVAIAGSDTTAIYTQAHPEVVDLFKDDPFGLSPVGWAVRQGDIKWLNFLGTALQFLDTQGTLSDLEKKYDAHWLHQVKQYQLQ